MMLAPDTSIAEQSQDELVQESRQIIQKFAKDLKGDNQCITQKEIFQKTKFNS